MDNKRQVHCNVEFSVSVEKIWDIIKDSTRLPQWMPNVAHTKIISDQKGIVGEVRECNVKMNGKNGKLIERCINFIPNKKISYIVQQDSFGFSRLFSYVKYSMLFNSISKNRTSVQLEYFYKEKGILGRFLNIFLIKRSWKKLCGEMLDGLNSLALKI